MRTCEGSATQAFDATSCGSFDFARRLAPLRMTLSLRRIRDPSARGDEVRILRLRSQARFAQDDTALPDRVRTFEIHSPSCGSERGGSLFGQSYRRAS